MQLHLLRQRRLKIKIAHFKELNLRRLELEHVPWEQNLLSPFGESCELLMNTGITSPPTLE